MKSNIVSVRLWDKEICRLQWLGGYKQGFGKLGSKISFNPEYHSYGFDVDPLGPFSTSMYFVRKGFSDICRATENEGLPRFLLGSLPDDWGNQVFSAWIASNNIRSSNVTAVDKLAFIGRRGMGGFEFFPEIYSPSSDDAIMLEELYSLAKKIENNRGTMSLNINEMPGIQDLMEVGMSAGGKHPKAIIAINWDTGDIRSGQIPLPKGFIHYLLKFRDSSSWPTAEIEYIYHLMAIECGIDMEKSLLFDIDGVKHFLTERFDRKDSKKVHSATLRALCGETTSYENMFKACRKLNLPYHDKEQLFRRAVFNYFACVCDDHDRNFSFLLTEDGKWRFSPAYDETFTVNLQNSFIADRHYMTIEECNRHISKEQFIRLAETNDIKNATEIIAQVAASVMSFESKALENGIDKNIINLITTHITNHTCE